MWVYVTGFTLSCLLFYALEALNKNDIRYKLFAVLALLIPCLIAGLRGIGVGTDTSGYALNLFDIANNSGSLANYYGKEFVFSYIDGGYSIETPGKYEPGFTLLIYLVTKITGSFSAVLFVVQAFTVIPVFLALNRERNKIPVWLGMAVYYFCFFNFSLNAMRQYISMAFMLYGFNFLREGELKKYLLISAVSLSFHSAGIVSLMVLVLFEFVKRTNRSAVFKLACVTVAGIAVLVLLKPVHDLVLLLWGNRFASYLAGDVAISPNQIVQRIPIILLFIAGWKRFSKVSNAEATFFGSAVILDILLSQLISVGVSSAGSSFSGRIAMYFSVFEVIWIAKVASFLEARLGKMAYCVVAIVYLGIFWSYEFVIQNYGETYPYSFIF